VYAGKKAAHFAAEAKPILAIAVSFFRCVPFADQQTQASANKQETKL
jgi:hypothetical protein